ncbi:flavodoxin family protein [Chloroflexota bacterium]
MSVISALIIYWSGTGNTKKVATTIKSSLGELNIEAKLVTPNDAENEDILQYDLVFLGSPAYEFLPPQPILSFVKQKMKFHRNRGDIKIGSPKLAGKTAVVFCTYSGPHTGINEVIPVGKYLGQFLEHIGFNIAAEWYVVGEFHGQPELSTKGVLGDIRGRPNERDLATVAHDVLMLIDNVRSNC